MKIIHGVSGSYPTHSFQNSLATYFTWFISLVCLVGCQSALIPGNKASKTQLPPGVVLPREKIEKWKALAGSAKDPTSAANVSSELLQTLKTEEDPQLRVELLRIAGSLPNEASWPLVECGLRDENPDVEIQACRLAAKARAPQAIGPLATLAQDAPNQDVPQAAIKALGKFSDPAAAQALGRVLHDRDPAIQYLAVRSLRETTGQDFGFDVEKWLAFLEGQVPHSQAGSAIATRPSQEF